MAQRSIISFLTHEAPTSPDGGAATLAQALDARVREGELIEKLSDHAVRCFACGHRCLVKPGRRGICKVRFNKDGTLYVPAGYATPEVLDYIRPWTDCYKIDFKAMEDRRYRELGGVLQHVLDAIRMVYERGFWLELVTLVVPGFNDDDAQLRRAADYIASVSPEIPWHVTAFHKDYRMTDPDNTSAETLLRACEIGAAAGLKFVYAGNLPGRVGRWEHTWCPDCGELLIERHGYVIQQQRIGVGGGCVACGRRIPGVWS